MKRKRTVRYDRQPQGIEKVHEKYEFTILKTMFAIFGPNTAEFNDKHIFSTVLSIFWPEFWLNSR